MTDLEVYYRISELNGKSLMLLKYTNQHDVDCRCMVAVSPSDMKPYLVYGTPIISEYWLNLTPYIHAELSGYIYLSQEAKEMLEMVHGRQCNIKCIFKLLEYWNGGAVEEHLR